jgi:acylphosphatase
MKCFFPLLALCGDPDVGYKISMDSCRAQKRVRVVFSGRVQGVGFRFTVCRIAEGFDVTGYVRNLWDGDVELVAEGLDEIVSDFLEAIRNSPMKRNIFTERASWERATGEFDRFGVSF